MSQPKAPAEILSQVEASSPSKRADRLQNARRAPRCIHVRANGVRCGCPAMREQPWCFFHDRIHTRPYEDGFPPLEDAASIQLAIMQVLDGLRRGSLESKVANSLLFGLKTASINLKHNYGSIVPTAADVVTVDPLDEMHEARMNAEMHEVRKRAESHEARLQAEAREAKRKAPASTGPAPVAEDSEVS